MAIPLLDLDIQNKPLHAELSEAFQRVLASNRFILGPELEAFEQAVAHYTGAKYALGVSSGTDAVLLAFMALDIGPGDEVLCPSFTFFATAGCISRLGAKPIFVDCKADTFNIDTEDAARKITEKTKAIIPVHLFGQAADMDAVLNLAQQHNLAVVEDAAQALGARHKGVALGTLGDFGTYSFFPSKNLGALGDAGMLVTNDETLAHKAKILRMHGSEPKYYHALVGGNFRMDALQAALLNVKLPHLDSYSAQRTENAAYYTEQLSKLSGIGTDLILPTAQPGYHHIWNQYTLRLPGQNRRDSLKKALMDAQIGCEIYYPLPLHQQECFAPAVPEGTHLPVTEALAQEVLSIPIYPGLTRPQQDTVVGVIKAFLEKNPLKAPLLATAS
tara:strand:- start:119965 stop:121128 length:1164 start_codon:yes stop_codon:yes gene_type:complete